LIKCQKLFEGLVKLGRWVGQSRYARYEVPRTMPNIGFDLLNTERGKTTDFTNVVCSRGNIGKCVHQSSVQIEEYKTNWGWGGHGRVRGAKGD
jgi:hypothetical protein